MKLPKIIDRTLMLFILIILEGYVVLSTELLAIRLTVPFVGSGTDTISIIIAAVLMPLACGYYVGGRFKRKGRRTIRKRLLNNILISQFFLLGAVSYALLAVFFTGLITVGIEHRLILTTLYCLLFLVTPVFLLGQTIPLVSNYFSKERLSRITGSMLFFSTLGSFLGAVFSTLVLMSTIGVHYTAALNFIILTFLVIILSRRLFSERVIFSIALTISAFALNSGYVMNIFHIVENNQYNTIMVYEDEKDGSRHLVMNNNSSSMYRDDGTKHAYIEFVEKNVIDTIPANSPPKNILVIGAGAFTFGYEDIINHYDYVDIDKSLRKISEELILKDKLSDNKHFHPIEARAFLAKSKQKYDIVLLDAYLGDLTVPEYLVTVEFFQQVKDHLVDRGIVAANFIVSPNFTSAFSRHIDNSLRMVFPNLSRIVIDDHYDLWTRDVNKAYNTVYFYVHHPEADPRHIYTDNRNTIFLDKPQKR